MKSKWQREACVCVSFTFAREKISATLFVPGSIKSVSQDPGLWGLSGAPPSSETEMAQPGPNPRPPQGGGRAGWRVANLKVRLQV